MTAFLKFLKGVPDEEMQKWYVSVMLNRLMFIYFIQKKNFLDNNENYLHAKLIQRVKRTAPTDTTKTSSVRFSLKGSRNPRTSGAERCETPAR